MRPNWFWIFTFYMHIHIWYIYIILYVIISIEIGQFSQHEFILGTLTCVCMLRRGEDARHVVKLWRQMEKLAKVTYRQKVTSHINHIFFTPFLHISDHFKHFFFLTMGSLLEWHRNALQCHICHHSDCHMGYMVWHDIYGSYIWYNCIYIYILWNGHYRKILYYLLSKVKFIK